MSSLQSLKEERVLNPPAFNQLLSWLDDGADSQGETYLEMRRRLVAYFDRRNRLSADDLADEVMNRVARTLETDGYIATSPPARYCYVVACLDRCLQELRVDQRELVIEYYRDSKREKVERRQALAKSLGITMNALAIRASRIRATLEACVTAGHTEPE